MKGTFSACVSIKLTHEGDRLHQNPSQALLEGEGLACLVYC